MASNQLTSNGRAFGIAVAAIVGAGVVGAIVAIGFGASLLAVLGDDLATLADSDFVPAGEAERAELRELCADGELGACDELYFVSPIGSDDETFGSTCGGTSSEQQFGSCAEGGAFGMDDIGPADEEMLAALRDDCAAADLVACDELYLNAPLGSDEEAFGSTCGDTSEPRAGACASLGDLRAACADGNLEACDDLWFESPIGSADEAFGSTCGDRGEPTFGGCSG